MAASTLDGLKDWNAYKKDLKTDLVIARTRTLPFRLFTQFAFTTRTAPLLIIGKMKPELIAAVKSNAEALKASGECAVKKGTKCIQFAVEKGEWKGPVLTKLLADAGLTTVEAEIVASLEVEAKSSDRATQERALAGLSKAITRLEAAAADLGEEHPAISAAREAARHLYAFQKHGTALPDGETPEEVMEDLLEHVGAAEHHERLARNARVLEAEGALGDENLSPEDRSAYEKTVLRANKLVDDALTEQSPVDLDALTGPPLVPVTKSPEFREAARVIDELMKKVGFALQWQDQLLEEAEGAREALPALYKSRQDLNQAIRNAERAITNLELHIRTQRNEVQRKQKVHDRTRNAGARKVITNEIAACNRAIVQANTDLRDQRDVLKEATSELDAVAIKILNAEVVANRHGTGRHGAQTGIEQQVRRTATGGVTPDQPGNELGISREHFDADTGAPIRKLSWNQVDVTWEEGEGGLRHVVTTPHELVLAAENRFQATTKSSWFLSPVLEQEAVQRAVAAANLSVDFDEIWQGNNWRALSRIKIVVGKPGKAEGWGHGVELMGGASTLDAANEVLDDFRRGEIDADELLRALNTRLRTDGLGKGAKLLPHVRVILDRDSTQWNAVTWFPTDEPIGCGETNRWARKAGKPTNGKKIPVVVA